MKRQSAWSGFPSPRLGQQILAGICVLLIAGEALRGGGGGLGPRLAADVAALVVVMAAFAQTRSRRVLASPGQRPDCSPFDCSPSDDGHPPIKPSVRLSLAPAGAAPHCPPPAGHSDARVATERARHESEARYRVLAETASDMIFQYDLNFVRRYVSPATFDILGYRPEEMIGSSVGEWMIMHPDDAGFFLATLQALIAGKEQERQTGRVRHRAGHWLWVEVDYRLQRDGEGRPCGIVGVLRDITERRAAAEREAAANARLRAINDVLLRAEAMAQIGHWRYDVASREITCSEQIYRIYGWPPTRAPTLKSVLAACHPEDRPRIRAALRRAMRGHAAFTYDVRVLQPGKVVRCVSVHGEHERDAAGRVRALVGTVQDVTERTVLEHELREVQEARMIGRLAAGVAHDFNNLLQAVMGSLELIQDAIPMRSPLQKLIGIALTSTERGAHLSHHLLSYAARQVLVPEQLELPVLLDDVRKLLEGMFGARVAVACRLGPDLPTIEVDPAHLRTALLNIGINAAEAMPNGGTISLEAWREGGRCPGVVIAVSDTGLGMDEATRDQAFEPFYTTKGVQKTGLGLSMVKGFVRQSGGSVGIASEAGRGTRVELRLPAGTAFVDAPETRGSYLPSAQLRRLNRILLVDDMQDVLVTLTALLEDAGAIVTAAPSGAEALEMLARGARFDAMVTDYAMPVMSGRDLIRRCREIQPGLPAVITTGFAGVEEPSNTLHGVRVLRKPFTQDSLVEALDRAIMVGQSHSEAVSA